MVGMKRRESGNHSASDGAMPSTSMTYCQRLQFDNVQDFYLTTEPILSSSSSAPSTSATTSRLSHTKSVHFFTTTQVIEIPNRYYYLEAGISLWWTINDLKCFRRDYLLSCPPPPSPPH